MTLFTKLRDTLLRRTTPQRAAAPVTATPVTTRVDDLPPFTLQTADLMRYDPQVRIALGARNGLLMAAQIDVTGPQPAMNRWVQQQWDRIWTQYAHQLLKAKLYGFMPFEVVYRESQSGEFRGLIEFAALKDRHPRDCRLLMRGDEPIGYVMREKERETEVFAPLALNATFDSECTNPYGCALLARAYPAWYEKWMEGGAKRTIRLRMIKDAYLGDIFWYPPDRKVQLADGQELSWRDLAREVVESRQSGGAMTLPLLYDQDGRKLVDYTPPQGVAGYTAIFHWKKDLDLEIWKALEVPPEIIQASTSGSGFSGRWIPFVVALSAVQTELAELIRCLDRDILRPISQLNFGEQPQYEIKPRPLTEIYSERFGSRG
ncbi:hypothetical protein NA78x_006207 [Anatilimnocola sp. NA78]|uniref:phage portal protein family protein n=1 Tax=Anatilimnocola sp. NA78 TaxID=3415683 RepID=UPI003CE51694